MSTSLDITVSGPDVLMALLVLMVGARIIWFGDFFRRCWKATAGQNCRRQRAWEKVRQSTNTLQQGTAERHLKLLERETHRLDVMLVGGSISLAAWSQLFVSSKTSPASQLSGLTLGLLFAGASSLIAGPLLWRSEGLHLTLMGRTAVLHIGFGLIALSLASTILDLRLRIVGVVGIAVVLLIALREVADVAVWLWKVHPDLQF
jgi:hypothetical protein